ncbi:MAG: hypothetical protein HEQ35_31045 [Gloeotrichia echinulata IR180]
MVIGHWSLVIGHWSLVIGHWSLVIGHWSLVIGHWSLVIGHWSLVIGHWSLVISCPNTLNIAWLSLKNLKINSPSLGSERVVDRRYAQAPSVLEPY